MYTVHSVLNILVQLSTRDIISASAREKAELSLRRVGIVYVYTIDDEWFHRLAHITRDLIWARGCNVGILLFSPIWYT